MNRWHAEQLGSIVEIMTRQVLPAAYPDEAFDHYSIPAFDAIEGTVAEEGSRIESGKFLLTQPAVLVSKLNPRKMRVQLFDPSGDRRAVASTEFVVYVPASRHIDLHYLFHALSGEQFAQRLQAVATGTTNSHVRAVPSETLGWHVPVPPLEEQRRIAVTLDTIDEAIRVTERVIAKRRLLLAGLQESLFESNDGAARTTIGRLVSDHWPGEWGEPVPAVGLREVIVLRATNLDDYGLAYATGARRFVAGPKVAEKRLTDGDLLIEAAGGGPGVPVGRVRRFRQPADGMPYLTSNFFRALRPLAGVDPDYLFWLLDLEYRKPSIWSCQQQTTGIINLQVRDYLRRPVSYHQRSQVSIARTLNAALGTVEAESRHLQKLREARAGLAADLLSGRVRTVAS